MKNKIVIFWFRRDLRLDDNIGLYQALSSNFSVLPIFIFDPNILNQLENKKDRRVDYIHQALHQINNSLKDEGATLKTYHGTPIEVFEQLTLQYEIEGVYCNHDYEPSAINRDADVQKLLSKKEISFYSFKDQVIFEKNEILKKDQTPYTIYSYYAKIWKEKLTQIDLSDKTIAKPNFLKLPFEEMINLEFLGFQKTNMHFVPINLDDLEIKNYNLVRDFPAMDQTTRIGIALRFGTISIRKCVAFAKVQNEVWLSELIWREFFMQILYHFPHVEKNSFKSKYDQIEWKNDEQKFEHWCNGTTGIPIVDAGMRQLNATGFMHNRVRMIVASFLLKNLLIDWRWGELYFANKLDDYDLAANNGNWQWAAGSGCDAAPYFRVFNPILQTEKFDKNHDYIKKYVPEYLTSSYPKPIVDLSLSKDIAVQTYKKALQ